MLSHIAASKPGNTWSALPPELKIMMLGHLPPRGRAAVRRVCREWQDLVDNSSELWTGVGRLTLDGKTVWTSHDLCPESEAELEHGETAVLQFRSALEFLTPRCRLVSLELVNLSFHGKGTLQLVVETATRSRLELKSLAAYGWQFSGLEYRELNLNSLILSQPKLEKLVLGPVSSRYGSICESLLVCPPLLEILEKLQHLRILVLNCVKKSDVRQFIPMLISRLDCLVLYFSFPKGMACEAVQEEVEESLECSYPCAQPVQQTPKKPILGVKECKTKRDRTYFRIIWAEGGFELSAVFSDKSLHSVNFLADK